MIGAPLTDFRGLTQMHDVVRMGYAKGARSRRTGAFFARNPGIRRQVRPDSDKLQQERVVERVYCFTYRSVGQVLERDIAARVVQNHVAP